MHLMFWASSEYPQFSGFGIRLLALRRLAVTEKTTRGGIGLLRVKNSLVYFIRFCILIQFISVRCKRATSNRIKN